MKIQYNTNTFGPAFCLTVPFFYSSVPQKWPPFIKLQSTFHKLLQMHNTPGRQREYLHCCCCTNTHFTLCANKMKMQYEYTVNHCKALSFDIERQKHGGMVIYYVLVCTHALLVGHCECALMCWGWGSLWLCLWPNFTTEIAQVYSSAQYIMSNHCYMQFRNRLGLGC